MRFEVEHRTFYAYSGPVRLEPHVLRLRPRSDPAQRVLAWALEVEPAPAGTTDFLDRDGNDATNAWFEGATSRLHLRTRFAVETLRANPFDFVLHPADQARVPLAYPAHLDAVLAGYREPAGDKEVAAWALDAAAEAGHDLVGFLGLLARRMHAGFRAEVRRHGDPRPPGEVLAARRGPCRDFTALYLEACRAVGLAARFVSGYAEGAPGLTERELHAWAEVYLTGAGWRGWDPSMGLAVGEEHVAVAAGRTPRDAAPVRGTFRSDPGVTSALSHTIEMRTSRGGPAERPAS